MTVIRKIIRMLKALFTRTSPSTPFEKCPGLSEKSAITLDKDAPGKFGFRM